MLRNVLCNSFILAVLALTGCSSSSVIQVTRQYNAAVAALATERAADAHKSALAADLAAREKIAVAMATPQAEKVASGLLDISLSLGAPDLSQTVLQSQVNELIDAKTNLEQKLADQAKAAVAAQAQDQAKTNKLEAALGVTALSTAKLSDQEKADSAWFGIPGILRHGMHLLTVLFWVAIGFLIIILALHLGGLFYPPLGVANDVLDMVFSFIVTDVKAAVSAVISFINGLVKKESK